MQTPEHTQCLNGAHQPINPFTMRSRLRPDRKQQSDHGMYFPLYTSDEWTVLHVQPELHLHDKASG